MTIDWDDPAARWLLIERVGPDEYNRLIERHFEETTVERINGYGIRPVGSRFGRIYMVDGLGKGHQTLAGAREIARAAPARAKS